MPEPHVASVDYYFSLQSPWAYIGHQSFRRLVSAYDLKVNHRPVVLVDLFSETGGLPLMKRHPVRQRYRMVELQRWRDKRGLQFHLQPANWPFNARLADGVVIAALEAGHDPTAFCDGPCRVWEDSKPRRSARSTLAANRGCPASNCWSAGSGISARMSKPQRLAADVSARGYVLGARFGTDRLELLEYALSPAERPMR